MAELFQNVKTQLTDFYKSLDKKKKMWLAGGGLFVIVIMVVILLLTRPNFVPLVSTSNFAEMSSIVAKLDEVSIENKDDGSNTILVDIKNLTKARMAIALDSSISKNNVTWESVITNTSFTMTKDVKQQQIMLAKANELARNMEDTIIGVKNANVVVYIAPSSNFLNNDLESTMSVMLNLDDSVDFSQEQVNGLVSYLMNSVQNLPKQNISIINQHGVVLNKFSGDSDSFIASTQHEQRIIVQNELETKLNSFLGNLYGRTRVQVAVSVKLNYDKQNSTSKVFSPPIEGETDGMVLSMSEIKKSVVSGDTASGVPGTDTNSDATDYPNDSSGGSNLEEQTRTVNYALNEVVSVLEKAQGEISDISISIILDSTALTDEILTEDHKKELIDLVTTASGIETRSVSVLAYKFADKDAGIFKFSSEDSLVAPGLPLWLVGVIVLVLAVVVIGIFIITRMRNNKKKAEEIAAIRAAEEEKRANDLEEIKTNIEDTSSPKYQIAKFIDAKPEAVAALLKSWMNDL